ncbi:MAG: hypothetical protein ACM3JF_03195 [Sphaerimonospora mesophila]
MNKTTLVNRLYVCISLATFCIVLDIFVNVLHPYAAGVAIAILLYACYLVGRYGNKS